MGCNKYSLFLILTVHSTLSCEVMNALKYKRDVKKSLDPISGLETYAFKLSKYSCWNGGHTRHEPHAVHGWAYDKIFRGFYWKNPEIQPFILKGLGKMYSTDGPH
eukprot:TRINITY_DN21497_c0_g2_i1.p1 TRINITY_DN21497_c0_g2~~TRINITY_DN21497_c0_g2_i1.p1  ORF type:complete len:105 (-),score=9.22 TRINITY_DN21497_c0_g2_i1:91-405(-)